MAQDKMRYIIEADSSKLVTEVGKATKSLGKMGDEGESAAKVLAQELSKAADEVKAEMEGIEDAAKVLGDALGPELAQRIDPRDTVVQMRQLGIAVDDIKANADELAASLSKIDGLSVRPVSTGMDDVAVSSRKAGDEIDRSRSVLANFAGNAAQDLPGISGSFGALNVAAGQFAEYAAEGGIKLSGLAKSLGPIAAGTVAVGLLANHFKNIAETKAFNAERVKTFIDYLRQGQTIAEGLAGDIRETGEVLARWGAMSGSQNLVDEFARLGITIGDYVSIIGKSADEIEAWGVRHMGVTVDAAKQERSLLKSRGALNDSDRARLAVLDDIIAVYRGVEQETANAVKAQKDLNDQHRVGIYTTEEIVALGNQYREMLQGVSGAAEGATPKLKAIGDKFLYVAGAAADTAEGIAKAYGEWDILIGKLDREQALDNLTDGLDELEKLGKEAWDATSKGAKDAAEKQEAYNEKLLQSKLDVAGFGKSIEGLPPDKVTDIIALIDQGKLREAVMLLADLSKPRTVPIKPVLTGGIKIPGAIYGPNGNIIGWGGGGGGSTPPGVPEGATGGIVTKPTVALIGEAGPEAVIPLSQAPGASPLPAGMGAAQPASYTFNIMSNDPDRVVEAIKKYVRRNGPLVGVTA